MLVTPLLIVWLVGFAAAPALARKAAVPGTVDQLLGLDIRPFAIGHRGSGENHGEVPGRPIENTLASVRHAFQMGLSVVEVDAQLTRDRQVVLFHEDFLPPPDGTCLNRLTLRELKRRVPDLATLRDALQEARAVNQASGPLRGLVIVEVKAASPRCDPDDRQDRAIVREVVQVVRQSRMTRQVLLTSFSPAILARSAAKAPEIPRILAVSGLQFQPIEVLERLGPVTLIAKHPDLGLQWAEIGDIFRLPGYRSIDELLATTAATGVRVLEADLFLLSESGQPLVDALHAAGLKVFGFTADHAGHWLFLQSLGVDAIYTNDVELGVSLQAPIP